MGDMAEMWEAYAERSKAKRASNRENSARKLYTLGIEYTIYNMGAHLVVKCGNGLIDFWPGTGKWIVRGQKNSKRGLLNLVNFCQAKLKDKNTRGQK